ncbi:MAG: tRNA CCA-pyrophosphorylase [Deltaproteobacteria bacterium]|nr:MAG: tRNA CCA-pyrophosphorylase [Deltaproteobacteria bacterium]
MLNQELLEVGLFFHGHKCPAMPMGLKCGVAAMDALGVERAKDGQLMALIEIDEQHCATCWADGVMVSTGCTLGKGNIQKLGYGKWALTLIDKKSGKAVRVSPKAEAMAQNKKSEFFDYRKKGIPASQVPAEVAEPLFQRVVNAPAEMLLNIGQVFDYKWTDAPHTFESSVCPECGEMTVERNMRVKGGVNVCLPCSGYAK